MKFKLALQLYSVRTDMESDFEGTLKKVSEMGYDGVEFAGLYGNSPEKVKELCERYSLAPISAHVPIDELLSDTDKVISDYRKTGCSYIAIPYLMPDRRPGTDGFERTIEDIRNIAKAAKKQGIRTCYHNHDFEFQKISGKYALDILYDTIPADLLQTELDTCWVNIGGENPVEYVLKYSGRAPLLHLKDFYKSGKENGDLYELIGVEKTEKKKADTFEFRPNGYGMQDFPKILKAAQKAGTEWLIVEQDEPSMDKTRLECAGMSADYIHSIIIK